MLTLHWKQQQQPAFSHFLLQTLFSQLKNRHRLE